MTDMHASEILERAQRQQLEHLEAMEVRGEAVGGWKVGLTSGGSRDAFGPGIRPFGYILSSRILESGASLDWSVVGNGGIETEACFVIGSDVLEPVDAVSIRAFLAGVAPAFEINQRRIPADSPAPERIADDLANWGIVVGSPVPISPDWEPDGLEVTLARDGVPVATVAARNHIDDHFQSLATLANALARFDRRLNAGDRVITGAFGRAAQPAAGLWTGDFGPTIGAVLVRITNT